jgi:hypothetical protein
VSAWSESPGRVALGGKAHGLEMTALSLVGRASRRSLHAGFGAASGPTTIPMARPAPEANARL